MKKHTRITRRDFLRSTSAGAVAVAAPLFLPRQILGFAGKIGKLRYVECANFRGPIPYPAAGLPEEAVPEGVDWDVWQGPAPARPFNRQLFCHWKDGLGQWWGNWTDYANGRLAGMGAHASTWCNTPWEPTTPGRKTSCGH